MKPYYEDDLVTIYHGDSMEILPTIEAGSVAAVVTDPPYIIGAVSAGNMASKSGGWADMMNSSMWFTAWYREVDRLLSHTGSFWTFCNWRTVPVVMKAALDAQMPVTSLMVWDKKWIGPGGSQGLRPRYELCALLSKPGFAVPDRGVPDVWEHKVGPQKVTGHPAEKPEGLVRRIIEVADVQPGQLVVEPFLGSGTTAAAAKRDITSISQNGRGMTDNVEPIPCRDCGTPTLPNMVWCDECIEEQSAEADEAWEFAPFGPF